MTGLREKLQKDVMSLLSAEEKQKLGQMMGEPLSEEKMAQIREQQMRAVSAVAVIAQGIAAASAAASGRPAAVSVAVSGRDARRRKSSLTGGGGIACPAIPIGVSRCTTRFRGWAAGTRCFQGTERESSRRPGQERLIVENGGMWAFPAQEPAMTVAGSSDKESELA